MEFKPADRPGVLHHTNHPFVNEDRDMYNALLERAPELRQSRSLDSSQARCAEIERYLKNMPERVTADFAKAVLRSRRNAELPVCRPHRADDPGATYTGACLVMELTVPPVLHLAPGPPSETPFNSYRF